MARDPFAPLNRKRRLAALLDGAAARLRRPASLRPVALRKDGPPNLLILAVDTLRRDHVGAVGGGAAATPRLDALARGGVTFDDVLAPAPWTLPSFTSSLTGVMATRHGAAMGGGGVRNMNDAPPGGLRAGTPTLPGHLAARGYDTAAFFANPFVRFGLAESFGEARYLNWQARDLARPVLDWIRRRADRPFFCFALFNDPHEPTVPPPEDLTPRLTDAPDAVRRLSDAQWRALSRWGDEIIGPARLGLAAPPLDADQRTALEAKRRLYAGAVGHVDRILGEICGKLDTWGLAGNTVVCVYSDHGEEFLEHAADARDRNHDPRDLRGVGHGHTLFQELLHVPWLAWGPGVPEGVRVTRPVSLCDVAPTLCGWLGVDPFPLPAGVLEGLGGRAQVLDADGDQAVDGRRILLAEDIAYGPDLVAVRRGPWKLIARRAGEPLALYDLETDPAELRDRRADAPGILAELAETLAAWRETTARGADGGGPAGEWEDVEERVRRQLRELGYDQ